MATSCSRCAPGESHIVNYDVDRDGRPCTRFGPDAGKDLALAMDTAQKMAINEPGVAFEVIAVGCDGRRDSEAFFYEKRRR